MAYIASGLDVQSSTTRKPQAPCKEGNAFLVRDGDNDLDAAIDRYEEAECGGLTGLTIDEALFCFARIQGGPSESTPQPVRVLFELTFLVFVAMGFLIQN